MDQGHDLLQIKKELVIYLDKTSDLCMIEEMANSYKDIFNQISHLHFAPPLNISLALNYIMLAEISGMIYNFSLIRVKTILPARPFSVPYV